MPFLPRVITHNWRLKASSLALAVVLWAVVQVEPRHQERIGPVPVEVVFADTGWTLAREPLPRVVDVLVGGPTGEILRLAREGTAVRVPIDSPSRADTVITLRRDWVQLGAGTRLVVEDITPSTVRLTFEPARTRVVPLALQLSGTLPSELALAGPIALNPQVVRVRGAASRVAALDSVPLLPFDLSSVDSSGVYRVPVDPSGLRNLTVTPSEATVGVRVETVVTRTLGGVPVEALSEDPAAALEVEPRTVDVVLHGARTPVTAVDYADLHVVVPGELLRGMLPGEERRVPVRVRGAPPLVKAEPAVAVVVVRRVSRDKTPKEVP